MSRFWKKLEVDADVGENDSVGLGVGDQHRARAIDLGTDHILHPKRQHDL